MMVTFLDFLQVEDNIIISLCYVINSYLNNLDIYLVTQNAIWNDHEMKKKFFFSRQNKPRE